MKYRDDKGSLEESLKTVIDVFCPSDIINHLNKFYLQFGKEVEEIKLEYSGYDNRIAWETYNVLKRMKGETDFKICGQTNDKFDPEIDLEPVEHRITCEKCSNTTFRVYVGFIIDPDSIRLYCANCNHQQI